jgi:hypothetical protein
MIPTVPSETAAAETASTIEREVFVRDHDGGAKRIRISVADALVSGGLADRVSRAGHVRLKLGIGVEKLDSYRGAAASVTTRGRQKSKDHHPRCGQWRQPA